uniref:Teratocyte glycosyl hydrolase n=1 Tax=Cotesia flavipes TaxID=89805 RepID=A0A8K1YTR7_COTFL|nr:teratocyte glycosyl hydrolase [Cotesia flavipes]
MWFFNILLLSTILVAHGKSVKDDDLPDLEWPETFSLEALRIYLSAGFTQDYKIWRTLKNSRIDYNNGAVKSFVDIKKSRYGEKYNIHPEADLDGDSTNVCEKTKGRLFHKVNLETILPDTTDFAAVGTETIHDTETTKFVLEEVSANVETKKTIWAYYNSEDKVWLPKKYEVKQFNTWIGSEESAEIWEFNNVETEVSDEYFDAEKYCEDAREVSLKDDAVTKNLLFMDPDNDKHVDYVFKSFKKRYNRNYDIDGEHEMRKAIFKKNMRLVSMINSQNLGYKLSINQFSDRLPSEKIKYTGLLRRSPGKKGTIPFPYTSEKLKEAAETLPSEYDTRLYGLVGTVKNQAECGSCWTFGTTASIEGAVALSNSGKFLTLSNQAILDCAWPYGSSGCDGGTDTAAYHWAMDYGLPTQAEYGDYANQDGICNINNMTTIYKIKGFVDVTPYSETALKMALINHGPMSVSVNVNDEFQSYAGGIFYDKNCDPTVLNHEVSLVGYGEQDGDTYWILKNSWGPEWGIDGYMHISARDNTCGVATEPTYAVI